MIAYYHDILQDAANYKLLLNFHGATLPRGLQRTYPHLMTVEAIKGEEFITFEQTNADEQARHCTIIPFTRNVYDPMDFTPMVLGSIPGFKRQTTPAFELALPFLFTSGIQHLAEKTEGMAKMPDYFRELLGTVPVSWDEVRLLQGYPGKEVILPAERETAGISLGLTENLPQRDFPSTCPLLAKKKEPCIMTFQVEK